MAFTDYAPPVDGQGNGKLSPSLDFDPRAAARELAEHARKLRERGAKSIEVRKSGRMPMKASTILLWALIDQINAEWRDIAASIPQERVNAARAMAGEYAEDICAANEFPVPILRVGDREIPVPAHLFVEARPLWAHYLPMVNDVMDAAGK